MKTVYVFHGAGGKVLYVGSTTNFSGRLAAHKVGSSWFYSALEIKLEHFESNEDGYAREIELIKQLNPEYNKSMNNKNKSNHVIRKARKSPCVKGLGVVSDSYNEMIKNSNKRKSGVLKLRKAGLTWEAIGKHLGVSRQRAQQIGESK